MGISRCHFEIRTNLTIYSEGAGIWYIKQSVMARIAKVTLGVEVRPTFDSHDPEHRRRESLAYIEVE